MIVMRVYALVLGTSLLAACGGGETGINSGGTAAPAGAGGGVNAEHSFENPTEIRTYQANGGFHSFDYQTTVNHLDGDSSNGQEQQLYQGDATTVRNSGISITFNPRDAIFELAVGDNQAGVDSNIRFQDPLHRTDFGGARTPQENTPNLSAAGIQYLEVASGDNLTGEDSGFPTGRIGFEFTPPVGGPASETQTQNSSFDVTTFFYQQPGTTTRYVTYAGFLRNSVTGTRTDVEAVAPDPTVPGDVGTPPVSTTTNTYSLERGAFVFGEATLVGDVPTNGTGTYSGDFLATSVFNNRVDTVGLADAPTYFQWIEGLANLDVDFGNDSFNLSLEGTTLAPQLDVGTNDLFSIAEGASFNAAGSGNINLVGAGGFVGAFQQAWFTNPDNSVFNLLIAGSSIDGAFYGPDAAEAAGNLRIVGGTPDERIDILGVFTGSQP